MVEQNRSGVYTQVVYGPSGGKLALMNGQTLAKGFVPLAGGATAVYNSGGLGYYRHSDWLGSSRLASTPSRAVYYDGAYAPYGENYAETGTTDRSFTGQNQDTISSGPYALYDFLYREHHPVWGRWLSPDPAGLAAVNPANPQSWNGYACVLNNPTTLVDPQGLQDHEPHFQDVVSRYGGSCYVDQISTSCAAVIAMINAGVIQGIDSARLVGGNLILQGETNPPPGDWIPMGRGSGYAPGCLVSAGGDTEWCPSTWSVAFDLGGALDRTYGRALGSLSKFFRGRPPGQSFGACVDQNVNRTTFGLARNSTTVFATGLAGTTLTAVGSTSAGLSLAEDLLLTGASIVPGISLSSALTVAELGSQVPAVIGGAALGLFIGSVANCASQGVAP